MLTKLLLLTSGAGARKERAEDLLGEAGTPSYIATESRLSLLNSRQRGRCRRPNQEEALRSSESLCFRLTLLALLFICLLPFACWANPCAFIDPLEELERDIALVRYWDARINDRLPLLYNHIGSTGYFQTPSARMSPDGTVSASASYVSPYLNFSATAQLLPFLEAGITYRFFEGMSDPILSPMGFGVRSDKGANLKLHLLDDSFSDCPVPDVSVGLIDFIGTDDFFSAYAVATQSILKWNLELTLGWGYGRLNGIFGAAAWSPLRHCRNPWIRGISLAAEYDPIDYANPKHEPHPEGRKQSSHWNYGLKYKVCNYWDFSISRVRGEETAGMVALHLPFNCCDSWVPKTWNPPLYRSPVIHEPIGMRRPEEAVIQDLVHALGCQGVALQRAWISYDCERRITLWLEIRNECWRYESDLRERLECLLGSLVPSNVCDVRVLVDAMGVVSQQYNFRTADLRRYASGRICEWEMAVLSPIRTPSCPPNEVREIYYDPLPAFDYSILPFANTFWGSSKGKFKYAIGFEAAIAGELPGDLFYNASLSYTVNSTIETLGSVDRISPSQIVNVRSDSVLYYQENRLTYPTAFLQKNHYFGCGTYGRIAIGYFEPAYAGVAGELLWDCVNYPIAIGLSGGLFKKRNYSGLGFQKTLRKLDGFTPTQVNYNYLSQYFLDLYYDCKPLCLIFQASAGGFLAGDIGASVKITRYYQTGLRLYAWYTLTNYSDLVHGDRYNDFGVGFVFPLDLLLPKSCRRNFGKAMSAWLRDVGASAATGFPLYPLLYDERN